MDKLQGADDKLIKAMECLRRGLSLLDEVGAPGHIGAHIDLAMHQLEAVLGGNPDASGQGGD